MRKKWLFPALLSICCVGIGATMSFVSAEESTGNITNALKNIKGCTFEAGVDSPSDTMYPSRGVKVTTSVGGVSSFRYNGIFNLASGEDFIRFLILPDESAIAEMEDLVIRLTDIYDESRYINIDFDDGYAHNSFMTSDIKCNVSDRYKLTGYDWNGALTTGYGTSHQTSWRGNTGVTDWQETVLYYDAEYNEIRTRTVRWTTSGGFTNEQDMLLFDFDAPELGYNAFEGFTSNEVYISVEVASATKKAHLLLSKIAGVDLSENNIVAVKPEITLDWMGYKENELPYGLAGEGYSYPIFQAKAYSPQDGMFEINDIQVKYGGLNLPIKNGRFETRESGLYQICYNAVSQNGYKASKTVEIEVKEASETPLNYTFNEDIPSIVYEGMDKVYLPFGNVVGAYGDVNIVRTITVGTEKIAIEKDGLAEYFIPKVLSGEKSVYILRSEITDITGKALICEKEIEVCKPTAPIIEKVRVPKVVRVGYATQFAIPIAYTLAQDGTKATVPVTVKVNGQVCADGVYVPTQVGAFNVEFSAGTTTEKYTVEALAQPTAESGNNYFFATDNFTFKEITDSHVAFTKGDGAAELTFANALCVDNFSISFGVIPNTVREVKITLSDVACYNQVVELYVRKGINDLTMLYAGEMLVGSLAGSFVEDKGYIIIEYNDATGYFMANGKTLGKIAYYKNGMPFAGFSGNGVYLDVALTDADTGAELQISALNAQMFTSAMEDDKMPDFSFETAIPLARSIAVGQEFTVYAAKAWDVLNDIDSTMVQVRAPSGEIVYNGPCTTDIKIIGAQCGTYSVTYTAMDSSGWTAKKFCNVLVVDVIKPILGETFVPNASYEVGSILEWSTFSATDDTDAEVGTYSYVKLPSGQWKVLKEKDGKYTYTFTESGTYRLGFAAVDDSLNTSYIEYEIKVK